MVLMSLHVMNRSCCNAWHEKVWYVHHRLPLGTETYSVSLNSLDAPLLSAHMHLQVLTACLKSFAHGANDTANAAGPFAAVQSLYLNPGAGCEGIITPLWVLAFCGAGIVVVSTPWARDARYQASQAPG